MATKKSIIGKIAEDMAESARHVHAINKDNMAEVKADTKANFNEATTPNPNFVKFKETKGLGNKAKVVVEGIKEGAKENSEKEKVRRAEIQSHESYKTLLKEQRNLRQSIIKGVQ